MVVGPLSTLSNWVDEFKRWLPSINVILYHGSKDERQKLRNKHMPVGMADILASWMLVKPALLVLLCRVVLWHSFSSDIPVAAKILHLCQVFLLRVLGSVCV